MFGMLTEEAFNVQVLSSYFRPPPANAQRAVNRAGPLVLPVLPPRSRGGGGGGARSEPKGWAGRRRRERAAAARIGEAGMSAFLVNHSVPTQKAVDLVQRIYGPPGLSSSDQVSAIRRIRAQRRPVGQRCSSSNEQTLQSLRMRCAGRTA
jgi:hypothetical protein